MQILLVALTLSPLASFAGSISFGLNLDAGKLNIANHGTDPAFYPVVFRLRENGRWERLAFLPGTQQPAELRPGKHIDVVWPDQRQPANLPPLEALRPAMIRFFDQAGASFGQISFFGAPVGVPEHQFFKAVYKDGLLHLTPPKDNPFRATWILWPQEEGIASLRDAIKFDHQQPDARRIEWKDVKGTLKLDLGKGLPVAFLLHETEQGFLQQILGDGGVQGRQQRSAWLNQHSRFMFAAKLAGGAALALVLWQLIAAFRMRKQNV